jgi:outer membrane protein assembly factor BamB
LTSLRGRRSGVRRFGSGGVWAFVTDGNKVWSKSDAGIEMLGSVSPVAGFGIVAVASIDKGIMVYDSQSGSLITKIAEPQQIFSKPLIVNDGKMLIYAVESGEVVGYDLSTKAEVWRKKYANRMAMPILGNDTAAVVLDRDLGKFIGINPTDGSQIWEKTLSALAKTSFYPVYSGGKIAIISQAANKLYVLLSKTGEVILAKSAEGISSYPFMSGQWVYIGTRAGEVLGFNYNTDSSWSMKIDGPVSMVTADDNGVYALSASSIFSFAK